MPNLLEANGGQPQKQPKYIPIFMDRAFTGLYTQRAVLHDPSDVYTAKYYGGRPDALWMGQNIELTNRLTLQRRPGLSQFSGATYPTPPDRTFSFTLMGGTIQLIVDTGTTGTLALTSVANSSGPTAVYTGIITGGTANAFVGMQFQVAGFTNTQNNGTFVATASSATTLTLANSQAVAETISATAISSGAIYLDNQDGTKTLLFAKSPSAGQTYFLGIAGILYMGDGVDIIKYTPGNSNGTIWKWGILAPGKQPSVNTIESGAASIQWVPSTVWSTMGFVYDTGTTSVQQLNSITSNTDNSTGVASTTLGLTGNGQPVWNNSPGGTTGPDGSITWTNRGPIVAWTANTGYSNASTGGTVANPCIVYDPKTKSCYIQSNSNPGIRTSGPNYPNFVAAAGAHTNDGQVVWIWLGPGGIPQTWKSTTTYPALGTVSDNDVVSSISEPVSLVNGLPTDGTTVYWQTSGGGTSGATATSPFGPNAATSGSPTSDGDLNWLSLGNGDWAANRHCIPWTAQGTTFTAIKDSNGNGQVCISITNTGTTGGGTHPTWSTTYGATTQDNDVVWTCVGTMMSWVANTQWYLPVSGFSPPTTASSFGGASIIDSNNNVEFVINSGLGKSGAHPTWNTTVGGTFATGSTTDGAATWYNLEAFTGQSLTWQFGYVYAYAFKARSLTDFYSVVDPTTGLLPIPPGADPAKPLPAPTGSETGAISTASPVFTITGPNAGAVNVISGVGSLDPQVDTIVIYRSADGGGSSNMFELTEIPAPKPTGVNTPGTWTFRDFLPDVANNIYPGLNILFPAPINDSNDPPPSDYLPMVFWQDRVWGANGQEVNFSGGPDTPVGNPNENFAPADELQFLSNVVRLVQTSQGIATFLTDSIQFIGGGPATATFFSLPIAPGVGLLSFNALDVFAGEIYFFGADNMFRVMTPSLNLSNFGFPLGDQFANLPTSGISDATWNPANVYVAVHQNGIDNCIFVCDGSTGWYRLNPHQIPGASQGPEPIWSPFGIITNGAKMVQSVVTSPGVKKLLVGASIPNESIRYRDLSVFTDFTSGGLMTYDAQFTMGSITLAHPGQLSLMKFLEFDFSGINFKPTISYLLNEISGTFTPFVNNANGVPQADPPSLYGATRKSTSYSPNRYYFSSNPSVARCRHLQVKVDFGSSAVGEELYNMTIFGRFTTES